MKYIKKIGFIKNVAILSSGSISAQLILLIASPVLTRIYSPEQFGVLATFLVFGYICLTLATGKYELGVVLPKEDLESRNLVKLAITLSLYMSLFLLIVFIFSYSFFGKMLNMGNYSWLLLLVPIFVFLNALLDSLRYYSLRKKLFKQIAKSIFFKALGVVIFQLLFGWLGLGVLGLILGLLLSLLIGNQQLIKNFLDNNKLEFKSINLSVNNYSSEIRRYINFPKFSMPGTFLNTASIQLPVLFFSGFFSASITGFFSLTHRVLSLPMALVGNAVGDAFMQRANEVKDDNEKLCQITWSLYQTLLIVGIIPTAIVFYFGEDLFAFVFGEPWRLSGVFASVLSFWILCVFICSPISNILLVKERQKQGLIFQNLVFFSRLALFALAVIYKFSAFQTMVYFSILGSFLFFSLMVFLLYRTGMNLVKVLTFTVIIIVLGLLPIYLISLWI